MLKDWLVRAAAATLADGQPELTLARLQEYGLPEAQCESMAMEAAAGEQELHYTASRRERLWNLLGMDAATERKLDAKASTEIHPTGAAAETEEAPPQKKTTRHVGERSPGRDPVGPTEQAVEKPEKCAFSGAAVNLSPAQLAQAALTKL